jgi:putative AlgH/UPF0301 family transcriptional regulator
MIGHPLARGVVLVLEHNEHRAVGVVLNSEANAAMQQWCRSAAQEPEKQALLKQLQSGSLSQFTAGVEGAEPSAVEVPFTVCMASPVSSMEEAAQRLGDSVRVFVGRVEWEAGRLEAEISAGAWMFAPPLQELLFGESESLWTTAVQRIGENVLSSAPGVEKLPADISLT